MSGLVEEQFKWRITGISAAAEMSASRVAARVPIEHRP